MCAWLRVWLEGGSAGFVGRNAMVLLVCWYVRLERCGNLGLTYVAVQLIPRDLSVLSRW